MIVSLSRETELSLIKLLIVLIHRKKIATWKILVLFVPISKLPVLDDFDEFEEGLGLLLDVFDEGFNSA